MGHLRFHSTGIEWTWEYAWKTQQPDKSLSSTWAIAGWFQDSLATAHAWHASSSTQLHCFRTPPHYHMTSVPGGIWPICIQSIISCDQCQDSPRLFRDVCNQPWSEAINSSGFILPWAVQHCFRIVCIILEQSLECQTIIVRKGCISNGPKDWKYILIFIAGVRQWFWNVQVIEISGTRSYIQPKVKLGWAKVLQSEHYGSLSVLRHSSKLLVTFCVVLIFLRQIGRYEHRDSILYQYLIHM